ncbi:MAG TPA: amino acid ABC transporter permease [Candidatus Avidehalobacter gallistercoris]|uniref:Amino acid ABC transporter permease n=1 Tax=Candidatus Avidehalobacter gallistercoris TaxID=2840694 RepID=A0A9D1HJ86_9FIRM|nr:amino acid ABC transporter permease [Candidatus Avidehalobacter gallistercoris]
MTEAFNAVFTPDNLRYIMAGFGMTMKVAGISIILSIIIGTVMGLIRNYDKFILKYITGFYIEVFRNTPNLLWVFVCFIAAPFPTAFQRVCCAYVLFTSAMMAEIVRGGLNAIPKGQFEAAQSQGFTFFGTLWYIILPQCFRRIIPTMMSQIITVIKDTSFLAQVAVGELLFNTKDLMSKLYTYTGHPVTFSEMCLLFGFAALLYFVLNFTLSCIMRYYQRHREKGQGVGQN